MLLQYSGLEPLEVCYQSRNWRQGWADHPPCHLSAFLTNWAAEVLSIIKNNGWAIRYAPPLFRNSEEVGRVGRSEPTPIRAFDRIGWVRWLKIPMVLHSDPFSQGPRLLL